MAGCAALAGWLASGCVDPALEAETSDVSIAADAGNARDGGLEGRVDGRVPDPDDGVAPTGDALVLPGADAGRVRVGPAPLVTEFMARNRGTVVDDDGDTSDWIELYNPHAEAVALSGFGLSDGAPDVEPWWFPERQLAPHAYLLVWASGKDRAGAGGALHTDFQLSGEGEPLRLVARDGTEVQRFEAAAHAPDQAYGLMAQVLVAEDAVARVQPAGDLDEDWSAPAYDDGDWAEGAMGVGFDAGGGRGALAARVDRLQAYWSFEQVVDDRVLDGSPNGGHDGRLEEGARTSADGDGHGGGRALEGTGEGWMAVEDPLSFDFARDFTWSVWLKGRDNSGALISRNPAGTDWNQGSKALFVRGGRVQWDSGWVGNPDTGIDVTDDAWHHVAVTYRADGDAFRMYVDGVLAVDTAFDVDRFAEDFDHAGGRANSGLFVGQAFFSGGLNSLDNYEGLIDDVAIWDTVLEPAEVTALAMGEAPLAGGPLASLITTERPDTASGGLRVAFSVDDPDALDVLVLAARYDDGFLAWVNGALAASSNAAAGGVFAEASRDDGLARIEETHDVSARLPTLQAGENVLALRGLAAEDDAERWVVAASLKALAVAQAGRLARPTPAAFNAVGLSPDVRFSAPSGPFAEAFDLELSVDAPDVAIHFTLDGSEPTLDTPRYAEPIRIAEPQVVTARAYAPGRAPGAVARARFVAVSPALAEVRSSLPILLVDVDGGEPQRGSYRPGVLLSFDGDGAMTDLSTPATLVSEFAIRVRGQSSANAPKRPYRIELRDAAGDDRNVPLLGLPADGDWVLHGPFTDKSLVRNKLMYDLGAEIGLAAPRSVLCELYLNHAGGALGVEHYRGVYLLVERIEVGADRVDIAELGPDDDAPELLSGGYLLKFEAGVAEPPTVPGRGSLEIVSPRAPTAAQRDWIAAYLDGFPDGIDGESFVDLMVINELSRDQDAYVRSAYFYKDRDGPLVAGPLWDYNLVAGTGGYFDNTNTEGWQWQHRYNGGDHRWFVQLMDDPAFAARFAARWTELRAGPLSDAALDARIAEYVGRIGAAAERNFALWDNLRSPRVNGFVSPTAPTWAGQIEALSEWLRRRSRWIDDQLR